MPPLVLLFLGLFSTVASFEFQDCGKSGVKFGDSSESPLKIDIDESNNGDRVCFVKLTGVEGQLLYEVSSDLSVPVTVEKEDGPDDQTFYLTINRVDFEVLTTTKTVSIDVLEEENGVTSKKSIVLTVINLDDEYPTLIIIDCDMNEGTKIKIDNNPCEFEIHDPDGFLDKMEFSVLPGKRQKHEEKIFELGYKTVPKPTEKTASVFLYLQEGQLLDYDDTNFYGFPISVKDSGNHKDQESVLVVVNELPIKLPQWVEPFSTTVVITEEQKEEMQVAAVDGNRDLHNPIVYAIENQSLDCVSIDRATGLITIDPIDRDVDSTDQVTFTVKACLEIIPTSCTKAGVTLIVEDIDDNLALITSPSIPKGTKQINITVDEGATDLGLRIFAADIDLADNALYMINLIPAVTFDYTTAFSPSNLRGYHTTIFFLNVTDPGKLDFDDPPWQTITFQIQTVGVHDATMTDSVDVVINLVDINDEVPIFDQNEYAVTIPETTPKGDFLTRIQATDKDAEDANLNHHLKGLFAEATLTIEEFGGDITVNTDGAFDYEKQQEVIVDIIAVDAVGHTSTAQLTILITDVNDESPVLRVPYAVSIEENQEDGVVIGSISAIDIDTIPYLEFSINWDESYATKNAARLSDDDFKKFVENFIQIETIRDDATNNSITGNLKISEITKDNTPDFELFDSVYLLVVVTDRLTVVGEDTDSVLIEININDVNDNPPVFVHDTETMKRSVLENSEDGTVITSVSATDADIGTVLDYTIKSADGDTPLWVTIDNEGLVTVNLPKDKKLDCDDPPLYDLKYVVTASDGLHETSATITIDIIDENDNIPTVKVESTHIPELENGDTSQNGKLMVIELHTEDNDRDDAYHTVSCSFSLATSPEVTSRFKMVNNTIILNLDDNVNLDREEIELLPFETLCVDNPKAEGAGVSNVANPPAVASITLDDINDNAPTIKDTNSTIVKENVQKGVISTLQGEDLDIGDNGVIASAEITNLTRLYQKGDQRTISVYSSEFFTFEVVENNQLNLTLNKDNLRDHYGYLELTVKLTDKGNPPLSNEVLVGITVQKYNFEPLVFTSPVADKIYLLPNQTLNSSLITINGSPLPNFVATDQQDGKYITEITIVDDKKIFKIKYNANYEGQLQVVTTEFPETHYSLTIQASHAEDLEQTVVKTVDVYFFDPNSFSPVFEHHELSFYVEEHITDVTFYQIERAQYTDGKDLPLSIYYLLEEGDDKLFSVDPETGLISLLKPLDYKVQREYKLVIQASSSRTLKPTSSDDAKFTLTIKVIDANDNAPQFDKDNYSGVIEKNGGCPNALMNTLVTVHASDIDTTSEGRLGYAITSINASNPILATLVNPLYIDNDGNIKLNFQTMPMYSGFFTLTVSVTDEGDLSDTTEVKIELVDPSTSNIFSFANDAATVESSKEEIKRILNENFSENVVSIGTPISDDEETSLPISFFNEIKDEDEVLTKSNFRFFSKLKADFAKVGLTLTSFDPEQDSS